LQNTGEDGDRAYDGMLPHVAGARFGEFNHRFAQPSQGAWPTASFGRVPPFTSKEIMAGEAHRPLVIFTNSAAEYWRGDASMAHLTLQDCVGGAGTGVDLEDPPDTRSYLFASTQHGSSKQPTAATPKLDGVPGDAGFVTALPDCVLNVSANAAVHAIDLPCQLPTVSSVCQAVSVRFQGQC
jgi:hypothetical protein